MNSTGVVQDPFGGRRFARVDMRHNSYIARLLERILPTHDGSLSLASPGSTSAGPDGEEHAKSNAPMRVT